MGINLQRGRGLNVEMGGCHFFYYFAVQFNHINIFGSSVFELAMQNFHPRSHPSLLLKPCIICTFLIHCGSLQKMLNALFNLVWNTQKSKWTIFFECQGKVFLSIEKILEKVSQYQP